MRRMPVGSLADFTGDLTAVRVGDENIVVARTETGLYALDDCCSHDACPLSDGVVEDDVLICPCHGSEFDLRTGEALSLPATEPVRTFALAVADGLVYVDLPDEAG